MEFLKLGNNIRVGEKECHSFCTYMNGGWDGRCFVEEQPFKFYLRGQDTYIRMSLIKPYIEIRGVRFICEKEGKNVDEKIIKDYDAIKYPPFVEYINPDMNFYAKDEDYYYYKIETALFPFIPRIELYYAEEIGTIIDYKTLRRKDFYGLGKKWKCGGLDRGGLEENLLKVCARGYGYDIYGDEKHKLPIYKVDFHPVYFTFKDLVEKYEPSPLFQKKAIMFQIEQEYPTLFNICKKYDIFEYGRNLPDTVKIKACAEYIQKHKSKSIK